MTMNQTEAKKLYELKDKRKRAYQKAYQVYRPAREAWDEARMVSEIYKGQAIHFEERMDITISAWGFGNKRSVYCDYHNGNRPGIYIIVWNGKQESTWVWSGSLAALKRRVKEYVAFGKPLLPPRRKK